MVRVLLVGALALWHDSAPVAYEIPSISSLRNDASQPLTRGASRGAFAAALGA